MGAATTPWDRISQLLVDLYGQEGASLALSELLSLLEDYLTRRNPVQNLLQGSEPPISQRDAALIVYASSIRSSQSAKPPLQALTDFCRRYSLHESLSLVHILPFYPWDTDRGFSVIDYYKVKSEYGTWSDLQQLAKQHRLMFDFVANHASIENPLVQHSLLERHLARDDPRYPEFMEAKDFVIAFSDQNRPSEQSLLNLSRPRSCPVLTRYTAYQEADGQLRAKLGELSQSQLDNGCLPVGQGWVWTTFSRPKGPDQEEQTRQVDLNFANPKVLVETIRILLFYVDMGATYIRLDAIGYIWKKANSSSLHEPEVHQILQCIKIIMGLAAPQQLLIAEVNEPQERFFEYLGKVGEQESDLVYQFCPFPLALHAVLTKTGRYFMEWMKTVDIAKGRQFITVLGSHDGMGLKPIRGILPEEEIDKMLAILEHQHGALPNFAMLPGGQRIVYEICATPWDLINNPNKSEPFEICLARFMAVVTMGLLARGLPAFYINGLIGARNYQPAEGLDENRTINREEFDAELLYLELDRQEGQMRQVMEQVNRLLRLRAQRPEFAPNAPTPEPFYCADTAVVGAVLQSCAKQSSLLALINLGDSEQFVAIDLQRTPLPKKCYDLISEKTFIATASDTIEIKLQPYQTIWLVGK